MTIVWREGWDEVAKYDPDQPRDADGRFGSGGGESSSTKSPTGRISSPVGKDGTTVDPKFLTTNAAAADLINQGMNVREASREQRGAQKQAIAEDLARRLGDKYDDYLVTPEGNGRILLNGQNVPDTPEYRQAARVEGVSGLVSQWASTSNNESPVSLAMQEAANREFGLQSAADWEMEDSTQTAVDQILTDNGAVYQAFLRAQYEATQEYLAKNGITEMGLYRGVEQSVADAESSTLRPLSSYAYDRAVAQGFARRDGSVLLTTVPADRILSCARTGFGCLNETEVVVLGGGEKLSAVDLDTAVVGNEQQAFLVRAGGDYSGRDLSGANFTTTPLWWTNFNGSDLSGSNLTGTNAHGSTFIGANLEGANLTEASLGKTNFADANLTSAFMEEAALHDANFSGAIMTKVDMPYARASGSDFSGADLSEADLSGSSFFGSTFVGANLSGADLEASTFDQTNLSGANLSDAKVDSVDFSTSIADERTIAPPGWTVVDGKFQRTGA